MTLMHDDVALTEMARQKRDSLLMRRVVGGAFILGLVVLGLAFPMII
jgi:hypothetical protein